MSCFTAAKVFLIWSLAFMISATTELVADGVVDPYVCLQF